jgi:hypothetical protein
MGAMRASYLDVLGFVMEEDGESWIKFRIGSGFLTLRPRGQWRGWHDGEVPAGSACVQLAFKVSPAEVDACYEELLELEVEIIDPPGIRISAIAPCSSRIRRATCWRSMPKFDGGGNGRRCQSDPSLKD